MCTHPPDVIVGIDRELRIRYNYGLCLKKQEVKKEEEKKEKKHVITAVYHAISV